MMKQKISLKRNSYLYGAFATVLIFAVIYKICSFIPKISPYPFALGWSETSWYYYSSLFFARQLYNQSIPLPPEPGLYIALSLPYQFPSVPLWIHRLWFVVLQILPIAAFGPLLFSRMGIKGAGIKFVWWPWIFLFLLQGPVYFHLVIPVLIMLLEFRVHNSKRIWASLIITSIWVGLTRVNWFPLPGMLAFILYILAAPYGAGTGFWNYFRKPAIWLLSGTFVALLTQVGYIYFSGVGDPGYFFSYLSSPLLWYRLFPNATYSLGVLPGALLVSGPILIIAVGILRRQSHDWHPLRLAGMGLAIGIYFFGGLLVSIKIGGGGDLHNMDAYLLLLLIVFLHLVFDKYAPEVERQTITFRAHWTLAALAVTIPVLFSLSVSVQFKKYDAAQADAVINLIKRRVARVYQDGGEVLFISQRQLITFGYLGEIPLSPEYEQVELMEMAMAGNRGYLMEFYDDLNRQRYDLIIADPQRYVYFDSDRNFSEENNVWVEKITSALLCEYESEVFYFKEERIALYIPREDPGNCPAFDSPQVKDK